MPINNIFVPISSDAQQAQTINQFVAPAGNSPTSDGLDEVVVSSFGGSGSILFFNIATIGGDDTITLNGSPDGTSVSAGAGDDIINVNASLLGGSITRSEFRGGDGNDTFNIIAGGLGSSNSSFFGGNGDDLFRMRGDFSQVSVLGGAGNDTLDLLVPGNFSRATVRMGSGADVVRDNGLDMNFSASSVFGGGGNDFISLHSSRAGNGTSGLIIEGGAGADTIYGTRTGQNSVFGGAGNDFLQTFDGNDSVIGGGGGDFILVGFGADFADGGEGDDTIYGIAGANTLLGGAGNDFIVGGVNDDSIAGGTGNDTLIGGVGNDTIEGGDGNDVIYGNDINQQTSLDFFVPIAAAPYNFDPLLGTAAIANAEAGFRANGLIKPDSFVESPINTSPLNVPGLIPQGSNVLSGGNGNDVIFGGVNADTIDGGSGNDVIVGGRGSDVLSGGGASGQNVFVQGNNASFRPDTVTSLLLGNMTINWAANQAPDIITDFTANAGSTVIDRIAFNTNNDAFDNANSGTVNVRNALGTPNSIEWIAGDVVIFAGKYDANFRQFTTQAQGTPGATDVLAFSANNVGALRTVPQFGSFGTQSMVLLGAANQSFSGANFFGNFV